MAVELQAVKHILQQGGFRFSKLAVTAVDVHDFGRQVTLELVGDDPKIPPFEVILRECTEIHWDTFAEEEDVAAPLPGVPAHPIATLIKLGGFRREFKELTQIHTELFDLLVAHNSAALRINDQEHPL